MTVESTNARARYATNGTTGPFAVPFYFLSDTHIAVYHTDSAGIETLLTLTTHYSVTGAGNQAGGTVTTVTAYASGGYITILRVVPITQATDYQNADPFPAESHETALDKATMILQQFGERLDRALVFGVSDVGSGQLPPVGTRANRLLAFDSSGIPTTSTAPTGTAASVLADLINTSDVALGDVLLGVKSTLAGAVARTQHSRNEEDLRSSDFSSLQTAMTAAAGKRLRVIGTYNLTAEVTVPANTYVVAYQGEATINQATSGANGLNISGDGVTIDGLRIVGPNVGTGAAIRADTRFRPVVKNCVIQSWLYGINLRGCKSPRVQDNFIYGGTYDSSNSSDIWLYGTAGTPTLRTIISGNHCHSNNDVGIHIDSNSGDKDTVVSGNVIMPLDTDGQTALADGSNRRRYGVLASYNGTAATRAAITGNVIRDIPYSGVYIQSGTLPGGDVVVTGNLIYRCGFGTLYAPDASLRAGIFCIGGADAIVGNVVLDCTTSGIKTASNFAYSSTNQPRAVIASNVVARTAGYGIWLTNKPHGYLVNGNRVINSTNYNIYFETTDANGGNCAINGNHIDTVATSIPGIVVGNTLGGYPVDVKGNVINGADNTTNNEFNSGIWFQGKTRCQGNAITKFHRGINRAETTSVRDIVTQCSGNVIKDCNLGINGAGDGPWLVEANTFDGVTTNLNGCPTQGVLLQAGGVAGVIHTSGNAAPTVGTWAQGDHVARQNQAVASAKGYFCTVAGTPGTWVSEGNL